MPDAHVAVGRVVAGRGAEVLGVVAIEREAPDAWERAVADARALGGWTKKFDLGVYVAGVDSRMPAALLASAREWYALDHHAAHAALAYHDAPFKRPLIISSDGGNDGSFALFARRDRLPLATRDVDPCGAYAAVAAAIPAVAGCSPKKAPLLKKERDAAASCALYAPQRDEDDVAGKLDEYAALGQPRAGWRQALKAAFGNASRPISTEGAEASYVDWAASAQTAFQDVLVASAARALNWLRAKRVSMPDGVALVGACALNAGANSHLYRSLGIPVHVPAASSDRGLGVGALYVVASPTLPRQPLAYAGPRLLDVADVPRLAAERDATPFDDDHRLAARVAELLARGAVVGIARGRAEHGPRALGHRSLLADPSMTTMRDRLNRLMERDTWRPVPSIVLAADAFSLFEVGDLWVSPYLSLAPRLTAQACADLPAVCHVDSTARVQTLEPADEPWIARILETFSQTTGKPSILCNAPLRRNGEPLLSTATRTLAFLCETHDLDYVVIESYVFDKKSACRNLRAEL
ncbi:hypothetical protein CTAYLR_003949 [Chrysophaeum taylorii]|uniref:Carbamoyltransferase C-terminal domain-containing protein n=1 Tax=Chrysophaeum taylorii TaxID=2483200 RepID=A0AAD7U9F7_9STRA|nr:hypothetical protein CTAYLR_003949 [Chrysophaeum taylorii]